jgi:DNA-binding MurR/RpiR family transcriptional regulator
MKHPIHFSGIKNKMEKPDIVIESSSQMIDFGQLIKQKMDDLTKSEKQIAHFLRTNQEEAAFLAAGQVADRLDISEATVVRFARTLGFASYPALRASLQSSFRDRMSHSSRLRSKLDHMRASGDIFERLTVSEIDYLTEALVTVDRDQLKKAVDLIKERSRIFVFGLGPSVSLVDLMEIRLRRSGKNIVALRSSGREVLESLLDLKSTDLIFAICFFDLNPTLQFVLDLAQEVGCPVIALTDTLEAVVSDKADVVLAAQRGPVAEFHSLVVPMTIINTLLLTLARENQDEVMSNLDRLDEYRQRLKSL